MVVFVRFKGLGGDIDTEGFIFLHLEDYSTLRPLLFLTIDYIWEGQSFHSQQGPRAQSIQIKEIKDMVNTTSQLEGGEHHFFFFF